MYRIVIKQLKVINPGMCEMCLFSSADVLKKLSNVWRFVHSNSRY